MLKAGGALVLAVLIWLGALTGSAVAKPVLIVALGASNTWGKGVSRSSAYPAQLQKMLRARGIAATVRNAGINGNTTAQIFARLGNAVPSSTRVVILQPGGNDFRRGVSHARYRANIKRIKRRLRARGIRVVMMRNHFIGAVARSHRRPDGQHFTPSGYRALAARILPRVLRALGK